MSMCRPAYLLRTLWRPPCFTSCLFRRTHCSLQRRVSPSMESVAPSKKVLVPVADGSEPIEAVVTADVLRRAGADVTVASVKSTHQLDTSWGIRLVADALVSGCIDSEFDLIALPGGMPGSEHLRDCEALKELVVKQRERGGLYAAICAAPALALGSWGLLKGLKATCYPTFMDKLPSDAIAVESRVQLDGCTVTSQGPGTALEYSVALVECLYGKELADKVSGQMVMRPQHGIDFTLKELNPLEWKFSKTLQILVPIADGCEEMETVMIIDILRRAKASVIVASVEDRKEIVASRKVKLVADMLLDEALQLEYDLIVLPGGLPGAQAFYHSEKLIKLLKKQAASGKPYGAICASPAVVLEPHGLLQGKKATAYPALCDRLSDQSEIENRVVVDGNLITSRGPGTAMEFALAVVEKFYGHEKVVELAKFLVFT